MNFTIKELEDRNTWNDFVLNTTTSNNPFGYTFIQSFEWLDFQEEIGHEVLRLGVFDQEALVGLVPAVVVKAKRGKYLYLRHSPILDWDNELLINAVVTELKEICKRKNLWFFRLSPLIDKDTQAEKKLINLGAKVSPMSDVDGMDTWIMDIRDEMPVLLSKTRKKTRYLIKQAHKMNLHFERSNGIESFNEFWKLLQDTVIRQKWQPYSRDYIQQELQTFTTKNMSELVFVKQGEEYIAGGIFIFFGKQAYYHYGASLTSKHNLPGMYLLIWNIVELAKSKGCDYLNLWGIAPENKPNHPWQGLSQFKMKFPGFPKRWASTKDFVVSWKYFLTKGYDWLDKHRKGY